MRLGTCPMSTSTARGLRTSQCIPFLVSSCWLRTTPVAIAERLMTRIFSPQHLSGIGMLKGADAKKHDFPFHLSITSSQGQGTEELGCELTRDVEYSFPCPVVLSGPRIKSRPPIKTLESDLPKTSSSLPRSKNEKRLVTAALFLVHALLQSPCGACLVRPRSRRADAHAWSLDEK